MNILLCILLLIFFNNHLFASQFSTGINQPFTSIYGDLEIEPRLDALSIQFQYGIPSLITTSTLLNGGTITTSNSEAVLATSGTIGAVAGLQSKTNLQYRSGHQADAYFTAAFTGAIAANTKQYIGALNSSNGFGVGFSGTTFGIVIRNNGNDAFIPQSSFNGDKIDGAGSSGFNYNYAFLNVFHIAYGWLGASIIQFQIMASNGEWITFHTIQYPNSSATPSIANALLPISAQVYDPIGGNSLQLKTASWNIGMVAIQSNVANRFFNVNNTITTSTSTEIHLLTIRNQNTFNGSPNKMNMQLQRYYQLLSSAVNVENPFIVNIYKNATVTGTSFSSVNNNSVAAYSSTGTYTIGTGILVITTGVDTEGWNSPEYLDLLNCNILLYPGETLTMTVTLFSSRTTFPATVVGGFSWAELF